MTTEKLDSPAARLVIVGALLLIGSGWLWWTQVYQNPYNVFWSMLENSLSTSAVTKHVTQSSTNTKVDQWLVTSFGTQNTLHSQATISQGSTVVKTESFGTLKADYERYTTISTKQKSQNGQNLNFSSLLNKWASTKVDASGSQAGNSLFMQSMLGMTGGNLLPITNLTPENRHKLLDYLHHNVVFDTSYAKIKREIQSGRPVYTYDVTIQPVGYVGFEKAYTKILGSKVLDNVDPNNYQGTQAIKISASVDVWSHRLKTVRYTTQNHQELYSAYGINKPFRTTNATITTEQSQSLLGNI